MEMARKKRDPKKQHSHRPSWMPISQKPPEDMNDALKDLFGPMIEAMLQGEMDHHLAMLSNDKGPKKGQ